MRKLNMKKLLTCAVGNIVLKNVWKRKQLLTIPILLFASCGQPQPSSEKALKKESKCFTAIFEQDTVHTKIDFQGKKITGTMLMKYKDGKIYEGLLTGLVKGDTLMLKYDFKINQINKWYRNPIALLNRDGKLLMGVGKINIAWGSPIFDSAVPIDYEKGKFIFQQTNCIIP